MTSENPRPMKAKDNKPCVISKMNIGIQACGFDFGFGGGFDTPHSFIKKR
jgi:hypothetical protein